MAIEITIMQKGSSRKALPFEVIIGDELMYGRSDGTLLLEDIIGEGRFIAYNPKHIGRGFSVEWKEGETYKVSLRLTIPSHDEEIDDFYDAVTRIAIYWGNCKIRQDKKVLSLDSFAFQRSETKAKSFKMLSDLCNKTKIDKDGIPITEVNFDKLTPYYEAEIYLHCAKWPLILGGEEKAMLADSTDSLNFKEFLHEKQVISAYYAKAFYYQHPETKKFHAKFGIDENNPSIFPLKPEVPEWLIDRSTGKQIEIDNWEIMLFSTTKDEVLGEMPYADFIARLKNAQYYDPKNVLIQGVTLAEMEELLEAGTSIVQ